MNPPEQSPLAFAPKPIFRLQAASCWPGPLLATHPLQRQGNSPGLTTVMTAPLQILLLLPALHV